MNQEDPPPLRMAPRETPEELVRRVEREKRAANWQRENLLDGSLAGFRVGSVPYLNSVPLTRGIEDQVRFMPPSELAEKLRRDELDAALVSVTEVLFQDRYDVLDGIAVASLGEVKSVFLAHRQPLADIREVYCDPASLTSVQLLKVLLRERGYQPRFHPLPDPGTANLPDNFLLIGDQAIRFLLNRPDHHIWDLGAAWFEMTRQPFVYAVWTLRRGIENDALRRQLREARLFGLETLDSIIRNRTEFDFQFRKDYLSWHIHYHLGTDEKRGLRTFQELLRKHTPGPIHEPRFVP
ncbi:MAG TPA: menaquinone biosynthesis protein [Methylomirabilota bacterium]|nr:menaquinone biosynthesis protein [Methylomirabilota bacterium]